MDEPKRARLEESTNEPILHAGWFDTVPDPLIRYIFGLFNINIKNGRSPECFNIMLTCKRFLKYGRMVYDEDAKDIHKSIEYSINQNHGDIALLYLLSKVKFMDSIKNRDMLNYPLDNILIPAINMKNEFVVDIISKWDFMTIRTKYLRLMFMTFVTAMVIFYRIYK